MTQYYPKTNYSDRQAQLVLAMQATDLNAVMLNAGPSLTYLTGLHFHLSERPVVGIFMPNASPVIVLPKLEIGKLTNLSFPIQAFPYAEDPGSWHAAFLEGVKTAQIQGERVGIEPRRMRMLEMDLIKRAAAGMTFLSGEACLAKLRMQKDEAELANMQRAVHVAQNALDSILPDINPGMTERELAAEITVALLKNGSNSQLPFTPIVASGPNSANPHAFPSDRCLDRGDLLVLDWGANINDYFSDLTRTFAIGEPEEEMKHIARIVLEANAAARDIACPGIPAEVVDKAARKVVEEAGYGGYFTHRTGHGLGMEGHEEPYIMDGNSMRLLPGMTFTIEPGIYLPGSGGVRIEDNVVITEDGLKSLSNLPRGLRILSV